jgi:hypothetical protein
VTDLDVLALSDDELAAFQHLTPQEQAEFLELLEQALDSHWVLTPKQEFAEVLWRKVDWLLWGGAAAGGKSEFACWHANRLSETIPGHVTLLLRQSIPELRRSLILRLLARSKQFKLPMRLRKTDGQTGFHYENGSLIECGYLARDEHIGNYLSAEYDCMIVDEASQMLPDHLIAIAARLRTTKAKARLGARPHLGLFTNPGDVGHAWLYNLFVIPTGYGNRVVVYNVANGMEKAFPVRTYDSPVPVGEATPEQFEQVLIPWAENLEVEIDPSTELAVAFVPAKATDNPHIDPSYLKYLNALPERRRRQLRDGDWDVFDGQFFDSWNRDIHVVPYFDVPQGWVRGRGIDYGSTAPWACLYGAWDENGDCYVYRELYRAGLTPSEQALDAKKAERVTPLEGLPFTEKYAISVADPSAFSDRRGTGKSIADLWRDSGLIVTRAKNARVAGWANVNQYLWDSTLPSVDPGSGRPGRPRLFVMETCPNLIRTLPLMQRDKHQPEDIDTTLEDHAMDALRYLLAARPLQSHKRAQKDTGIDSRFQQLFQQKRKRAGL